MRRFRLPVPAHPAAATSGAELLLRSALAAWEPWPLPPESLRRLTGLARETEAPARAPARREPPSSAPGHPLA